MPAISAWRREPLSSVEQDRPVKLVTYRTGLDAARLGVLADGLVVDVARLGAAAGLPLPDDMLALIDQSVTALPALRRLLDQADGVFPLGSARPVEDVKLLAPIPRLRKNIYGIGLNYRAHVDESARALDTDQN